MAATKEPTTLQVKFGHAIGFPKDNYPTEIREWVQTEFGKLHLDISNVVIRINSVSSHSDSPSNLLTSVDATLLIQKHMGEEYTCQVHGELYRYKLHFAFTASPIVPKVINE